MKNMIQPVIVKKSAFTTIFLNILIIIIPFGIIYVIVKAIQELNKTKTPIYKEEPIRVRDRRYKVGYRIDGWTKKKTGEKRSLTDDEIQASKYNGKLRLFALGAFFVIGAILSISKI